MGKMSAMALFFTLGQDEAAKKGESSAGKMLGSSAQCRYTWVVIGHARSVFKTAPA